VIVMKRDEEQGRDRLSLIVRSVKYQTHVAPVGRPARARTSSSADCCGTDIPNCSVHLVTATILLHSLRRLFCVALPRLSWFHYHHSPPPSSRLHPSFPIHSQSPESESVPSYQLQLATLFLSLSITFTANSAPFRNDSHFLPVVSSLVTNKFHVFPSLSINPTVTSN
jgi:hypothetical protein